MNLNLLFIDDDNSFREDTLRVLNNTQINNIKLSAEGCGNFDEGMKLLETKDFDLLILDLYQGSALAKNPDRKGLEIFEQIQQIAFIPIIFYSGLTKDIEVINSDIVRIVNKSLEGIDKLIEYIKYLIDSNLAFIKKKIYDYIRIELRDYFWKSVHDNTAVFNKVDSDFSLGYLLLRRIANSLSKDNIKLILGDEKIQPDKVHPMEFYIYPIGQDSALNEYQSGEILEKEGHYYVVLTPDCDLILRRDGSRKADKILLALTKKFTELPDFIKYNDLKLKESRSTNEDNQLSNLKGKQKNWMKNKGGDQDRYFFLPQTPFINNFVIDFQDKLMFDYSKLSSFNRIAKLDTPYAQAMISSFIRYYNRIGFPDIDTEYILEHLDD